jgi:hypothetical protein
MSQPTPPFTRADIKIDYWTAEWGAPCAHVTIIREGSFYTGQSYGLRSCKGMKEYPRRGEGWHYLVDREPRGGAERSGRMIGDYLGSMGTDDLERAINGLLADFTKWDMDQRDQALIAQQARDLVEVLRELDEWDPIRTTASLRSRWSQIRILTRSVEMALYEPPVPATQPVPPLHSWHSRVATLGVPARDGRTMRGAYSYELRDSPVPLLQDSRVAGSVCQLVQVPEQGSAPGTLWAYGTTSDPDLARQLISGQLFASVALQEEPGWEVYLGHEWRGGTVRGAVVLPADLYPWEA